jgi:hypothetical protein
MGLRQELVEICAERKVSHLIGKKHGNGGDHQQNQQAPFNDKVG